MNFEEAMSAAYEGMRVRHAGFQPGIYVEHSFSRGLLKCWPVETPDLEPNRTQCDFRPHPDDLAATWTEQPTYPVRAVEPLPGNPKPLAQQAAAAGWGASVVPQAIGRVLRPPVADQGPAKGWQLPPAKPPVKPIAAPTTFCAECDFETSACKCPKPVASGWGKPIEPKKEPNKWGQ